jgi:hypothetical protein
MPPYAFFYCTEYHPQFYVVVVESTDKNISTWFPSQLPPLPFSPSHPASMHLCETKVIDASHFRSLQDMRYVSFNEKMMSGVPSSTTRTVSLTSAFTSFLDFSAKI